MEQSEVFSQQCLHPSFRVFGVSYDYKRLKVYAYTLSQDTTTYLSDIGNFILDWLSPKQDIQVTTSGSTGVPKQISIQKSQMYESALATGHFFKLSTSTKALLCLSSNYIAGKMMLVRAMVLGWDLHWVAPTASPLKGTDAMYSFVAMVPLQLQNSLQELFRVKKIIVGGGQVSQSLIKQLPSKETLVFETYGMTETVSHIAVRKLNHNEGDISYFEILPHIRIGVDDRSCLRITAPKLCDEVLQTNDIVDLKSLIPLS